MPGPVVAGILAVASAEDVLRHGFAAADDRGVRLHVLVAAPAATAGPVAELRDLIERWTEKYPGVPVMVSIRAGLDAAIVLAAAARGSGLLVVAEPRDARESAVVQALTRRTRGSLVVAPAALVPL